MIEMTFLTPVFQSLLASAIYGIGVAGVNVLSRCKSIEKRYRKAFENAIHQFYADPKYAGNEARRHYDEYIKMLQDGSKQQDILSTTNHVYKKLFDLFVQEVLKDKYLYRYVIIKSNITTQKRLQDISDSINDVINKAKSNRDESKSEHLGLSKQIDELKDLLNKNPDIIELSPTPIKGSAVDNNKLESHIIHREELVNKCIEFLDAGKILIIHGALKVGKTTLAQLIVQKKKGIKIIESDSNQCLETIVFNLIANHQESSYIVITTSELYQFASTLDFSIIEQVEVPLLSLDETAELVQTYHPSKDLTNFIFSHTSGHPLLIKTLCTYLSSCDWNIDKDNFEQILNFKFDHNLPRALSDMMCHFIKESDTRNMLNRLMLIFGCFTEKEVCLLAEVAPKIDGPKSRLYSLVSTWITENNGRYKVSPLLKKGWQPDLPNDCMRQCNKQLAQNIINSKHPLNEIDILGYITYSTNAGELDDAGLMYITFLMKLHDLHVELPQNSLLRGIWADLPLPIEMSLKVRIEFRLAQLMLLSGLSYDIRHFLLWDLKRLLDGYEGDNKSFYYGSLAFLCWQEEDIEGGLKYYNLLNTMDNGNNSTTPSFLNNYTSLINKNIWYLLIRFTKIDEFVSWLDSFSLSDNDYSHSNKEVCTCCYLSVIHLISQHMQGCDENNKLIALYRIQEKAEQKNCPELAIVCLFKILDLYAVAGKYDDAKELYEKYYSNYKKYPLAEILLNGVMAFVCFRSKHWEEENWHYFTQAINASDKNLIPDVQLHAIELYAYVVAEKNPVYSIELLKEALEYADDESHRIDLFDYYQCKGELSYAFWCIGNKEKAVELLSDCVKFVIPLAENEKDYSKTYLCLCNCLINYYSVDLLDKEMNDGCTVPIRGMFTESNPMGFDDIYTTDRLYVSSYQMCDLCNSLQLTSMEHEWAKMTIETCRSRNTVEEVHYLIFKLLPLFLLDDDLENAKYIIDHSAKAIRLTHRNRPELLKKSADLEFVEFQIIPLLIEALMLKLRGSNIGLDLVRKIINNYTPDVDFTSFELVKMVFNQDEYNECFIRRINKLDINENYSVYLCAYLMTAFYSDSNYAFSLLIIILPNLQQQLELIIGNRVNTLINKFVSTFWKVKILQCPNEFLEYALLKDKGLKMIDKYNGKTNQANHTMLIISHHLSNIIELNSSQEKWLEA